MDRSARKVRQGLCADALFKLIRERCERLPDARAVSVDISLADALLSAFAMFSLKDPSLLAFDHRRQDPSDNFRTVYGIECVPCDSQMRTILDPVDPDQLRPLFQDVFRCLQRGKALEPFVYLDGHYLLSLDGTTYFSSNKVHCSSCLEKRLGAEFEARLRDLTFWDTTPIGPLQNDLPDDSIQGRHAPRQRIRLLKGCDCSFRSAASVAAVLFE